MTDELKPMEFTDEEKAAMAKRQYFNSVNEWIFDCLLGYNMHGELLKTKHSEKYRDAIKAIEFGYYIETGKPHPYGSDFCDVPNNALFSGRGYAGEASEKEKRHMVKWRWLAKSDTE